MHFHYRVTFTGYIRCFCATTSHGLVTLTFDLLTFRVFYVQCFLVYDAHTNFYYPMTIGWGATSAEYLITFPLSETVAAHAPCHVTSNGGQKYVHIYEIHDPNLPIRFVTFRALRRRLSHVIGKK